MSFLGPLQLIVSFSQDLQSGLEEFCRYVSVQNTGYQPYLDMGSEEATFQLVLTSQLRRWGQQWIDESLMIALRLLRGCLGDRYVPRRISLRHAAISDRVIYERYYGCEVCTQAPIDGVTIDRHDLEVVNARWDPEVLSVLTDFLGDYAPAKAGVNGLVQGILRRSLGSQEISIEAIAEQLGVHKRTLQRRLRESGTSFADLLEKVRADAAWHYVASGQLPLTQIALLLGFSEQSAFNHAFRRWYQRSPREWARRAQAYTEIASPQCFNAVEVTARLQTVDVDYDSSHAGAEVDSREPMADFCGIASPVGSNLGVTRVSSGLPFRG